VNSRSNLDIVSGKFAHLGIFLKLSVRRLDYLWFDHFHNNFSAVNGPDWFSPFLKNSLGTRIFEIRSFKLLVYICIKMPEINLLPSVIVCHLSSFFVGLQYN